MKNRKMAMLLILAVLIAGIALIISGVFSSNNPVTNVPDEEGENANSNLQKALEANINQWIGDTLSKSGWLHVVTRHDREKDQVSSLPSGQIIPEDYMMESWYFLNDEGLVSEMVTLMTDLDGNVVQVSTFSSGIWKNLTMGKEWSGSPFALKLDFGLGKEIANSSQANLSAAHYTSELEGIPVGVFAVEDHFDQPVHMSGYDTMFLGSARKAYFDLNSGALLLFERTLTAEDGTIYTVEQAIYVTIENVGTLPDHILAYLVEE